MSSQNVPNPKSGLESVVQGGQTRCLYQKRRLNTVKRIFLLALLACRPIDKVQ